ncbi:exodeoxyribonuclease V subunit alpha [Roseisolibacter sp. H3M3-2]|uniref:exodeoxyribonuclease V subunit alpha n=1 Tax=Roseisolibacter sp. H3M3-2 TaxID=3031323 RepID=UPI0023DAACA6|nr:exodeoxyribonuclease V subunit alpha [Roseisolibacter sp. H3M3-2]MDF1504131.1 exodeoxyribonuclease V subunit alpha [Roseisolibacter sp. H3M3-2]
MTTQRDLFAAAPPAVPPVAQPEDVGALDRRWSPRDAASPGDPLAARRATRALRDVDVHFARAAARLAGGVDPLVLLGLAAASRASGDGHVYAELDAPERLVRLEGAAAVAWPDPAAWRAALEASPVVATAREAAESPGCPLVLDGHRLYLARYWGYQRRLLAAGGARAALQRADVDRAALAAGLARYFPEADRAGPPPDLQRAAAAAAVLRALVRVTGGPGTGKTTTVLDVRDHLVEQARALGLAPVLIALAAPTGKAAARMGDAIARELARLAVPADVAAAIPRAATTLHRLLGWQPHQPTRFRHDAARPLPADVVVVDEGSMVDLALMAKLLDAVPEGARLVLLGDRDQLVSVEAGTILADVCGDDDAGCSPAWAERLAAVGAPLSPAVATPAAPTPAVADCVVRLRVSRRFTADGGIGALARAVNAGDADAALAVLRRDPTGQVTWLPLDAAAADVRALPAALREGLVAGYRRAVRVDGPKAALAAFDAFRVLAAHRERTFGAQGLNAAVVDALVRERTVPREAAGGRWWPGQPVMVTENDHAQELYNGDVGVVLSEPGGALRVWFRAADGGVRGLAPARLPAHETVFAMTVHKSQGSEFDEVVLVLPPRPSPVLTRELLYTGVTRARQRVTVVGTEEVLRAAIAERVQRASGLREALWEN